MKKAHLLAILTLGGAMLAAAGSAPDSPSFDLSWNTVDGGGGISSGGTFQVFGTIGQHDAGVAQMSGGSFTVAGGFWPGGVTPLPDCPADIAIPHNGLVNIDDLLFVITQWGQPGGPADINHDNIVNIDDLLAVIIAWGMCP